MFHKFEKSIVSVGRGQCNWVNNLIKQRLCRLLFTQYIKPCALLEYVQAGAGPASEFRGAISVIFGSQVS